MSEQPTEYGKELIADVARAITTAHGCSVPRVSTDAGKTWREEIPSWATIQASAALLAACAKLKEPSEAMADKGESSLICGPEPKDIEGSPSMSWAHAKSCFRAMLSQLRTEMGI